jgi:hypothetical protein
LYDKIAEIMGEFCKNRAYAISNPIIGAGKRRHGAGSAVEAGRGRVPLTPSPFIVQLLASKKFCLSACRRQNIRGPGIYHSSLRVCN